LIILLVRVATGRARGIVIDLFGEIIVGFRTIASRSLATVETAVNVEVRSRDKDGIIQGTDFTGDFRGDLVFGEPGISSSKTQN
jgi:hypothetical protein